MQLPLVESRIQLPTCWEGSAMHKGLVELHQGGDKASR